MARSILFQVFHSIPISEKEDLITLTADAILLEVVVVAEARQTSTGRVVVSTNVSKGTRGVQRDLRF